ncbi:FAD-binding oxidoreductase [Streptosporangium sp. NPDC051023]|uniref:FAD-binding oxidoreductase n=1 Tax=Streptosporangium sp. NPDC051023 TaxID=3155410 RepID=UPI00344FE297
MDALRETGATIRRAGPEDAVAGITPRWVALPETTAQVAALMRVSAEHDLAVVPVGDGTKLGWGNPPERCDLVMGTRRLVLDGGTPVEHSPGDLVARVSAGLPVDSLASFPGFPQELALDNPLPAGTVGGTLATAIAGPRRFRYGTARDLLIGVTVVLADGTVARSGGQVVKNVAGYDLGKLLCGSYGTLGVITEAVFRLHPAPPERRWITVEPSGPAETPAPPGGPSPSGTPTAQDTPTAPDAFTADPFAALDALVAELTASQAEPSAIEVEWPDARGRPAVAVLVEGTAAGERARAVLAIAREHGDARIREGAPDWWNTLPGDKVLLEVRVPPAGAGEALRAVAACGLPARVRGSVASGVLGIALPEDVGQAAFAAFVSSVRVALGHLCGGLTVLAAPYELARGVDRWGPTGALPLMRRVKERFDPDRRMSPGRLVGGI